MPCPPCTATVVDCSCVWKRKQATFMPRPYLFVILAVSILVAIASSAAAVEALPESVSHDRVTFTLPVVLGAMGVIILATAAIIRKITLAEVELEAGRKDREEMKEQIRSLEEKLKKQTEQDFFGR